MPMNVSGWGAVYFMKEVISLSNMWKSACLTHLDLFSDISSILFPTQLLPLEDRNNALWFLLHPWSNEKLSSLRLSELPSGTQLLSDRFESKI